MVTFILARIVSGANNRKPNSNWLKQTDKGFIVSHNEKPNGGLQAWLNPGAQEV